MTEQDMADGVGEQQGPPDPDELDRAEQAAVQRALAAGDGQALRRAALALADRAERTGSDRVAEIAGRLADAGSDEDRRDLAARLLAAQQQHRLARDSAPVPEPAGV